MKILIDKNETLALCGNLNGTVYIFRIKLEINLIGLYIKP